MKITFTLIFIISSIVSNAFAQAPTRNPAEEMPVLEELRKLSPKSVDIFVAATDAMDNARYEEAESLYLSVLKAAPDFEPAMRRLGYTYVALGKRTEGQEMTKRALDKNRSVDNLVGRANTLVSSADPQFRPSFNESSEAMGLAREAWKLSSETDEGAGGLLAELLLQSDQMTEFDLLAAKLKSRFPDSPMAAYYYAISIANHSDFDGAEKELLRAESLGAPSEMIRPLLTALEKARDEANPFRKYNVYIYIFLALSAIWALGLLGLYVLGRRLSAKTLATIQSSDPNDLSGGGHAALKETYRRLINFASLYYYISQPMVVLLVVFVTAAVIIGFYLIGRIPIGFLIGLIFVGGGSIFYMFKSLIIRPKVEDPGRVLETEEAPRLWNLVRNVADDIKTRPVDEIRITPGVEIAVYERGGFRQKMQDKGQRILILGAGSFNRFSANSFRAVLAHEYGHLSNRDTAGGEVAFRVNSDMARLAEAMVNSGTNTYHNLAFHFLRLYHFIFRRITHGASRLQEVLADRVAVHNYGATAFAEGLRHVVRQGIAFDKIADAEVSAALSDRRKFNNLYNLKSDSDDIESAFTAEFERPTDEDDTHPSGSDRIRLAEKIKGQARENIDGFLWDLFVDQEKITNEMTIMIEKQVRGDRYSNYHDIGISRAGDD